MKLKKIVSAIAAAALAVSMTAFSVSAEEIWSGSNDLGTEWDGSKAVMVEVSGASEGDELVVKFTCTEGADYYNLQLCANTDGWPKLTAPTVNEWGSIEVGGMDSYSCTLNAADAEAINTNGLVVFGYAITITSVELNGGSAAPAEKAEEAPAADSTSTPAATGNTAASAAAAVMAIAGVTAVASRKRK